LLVARTRSRRKRVLVACAVALLLWSLLAWVAARALIAHAELAHADALVVLAGSSAYVERTRLAAQLYAEGRASVVLLTNDNERGGWSSAEQRNPFFVERAVGELTAAGVPREHIVVLPQPVTSTYDEARALRDYAAAHDLRALLVVTSAYHSRRALWTLRRVFAGSNIEVGLMPVAPGAQTPLPSRWWLSGCGWRVVAVEYVKLFYYRIHY
jgi:uncharacterized SAM-binding protein YcdF (DUF218 family)